MRHVLQLIPRRVRIGAKTYPVVIRRGRLFMKVEGDEWQEYFCIVDYFAEQIQVSHRLTHRERLDIIDEAAAQARANIQSKRPPQTPIPAKSESAEVAAADVAYQNPCGGNILPRPLTVLRYAAIAPGTPRYVIVLAVEPILDSTGHEISWHVSHATGTITVSSNTSDRRRAIKFAVAAAKRTFR